ncbi:MAG: T9SS type A sorting domain-containing protein [Cytophagaceae bacterium]
MKKSFFLSLTFLVCFLQISTTFGQTGTVGNPFTELGQARGVTSAGIYYFNLGGVTFNTHVDVNGYVQIAIDFGNGAGQLPQETSLSLGSRGILNSTALASLTSTSHVRLTLNTGALNAVSTNPTIISRVQTNFPLHRGGNDNAINNSWSGTGSNYITTNAGGCNSSISNLHQSIIHVCGNTGGMHWIPNSSNQRLIHSAGNIASGNYFQLWVTDANYILPIDLMNFKTILKDERLVELSWQTSSETNNDYFTIEKSKDGTKWIEFQKVDGAGSSSQVNSYGAIDHDPLPGNSYYRLKQTDFNGDYTYSKVASVFNNYRSSEIYIYPNPTSNYINLQGNYLESGSIKIYNVQGDEVTEHIPILSQGDSKFILDFSNLFPGIYSIITQSSSHRIYKQ